MSFSQVPLTLILFLLCGLAQTTQAQVSKGQQILINRGPQIQGMVTRDDVFHLSTYSNANYTSIHWLWTSSPSQMGPAPGFPWSRWVGNENDVPPQGTEGPYMSQLVSLQLGDEWNLNDVALRDRAVNWFNAIRTNFPNTILYMNNFGGQVGDAQLGDFISRARPDMLCFDTYPWRSDYTTSNAITGPPTSWYGDLRRYREHARANNLPLGTYMQTFHARQDYDRTMYRDPSPSELRLNHSAALAFNAKVLIDFTYNTGASSLFTSPGGDSNPTGLLAEKADAALRARNVGRALVRLKPMGDAPGSYTTSIMFIRGRNSSGTLNTVPIGFIADSQDPTTTDWAVNRNDPYLRSWGVTNRGTRNSGQPGDVIVSWFRPLDELFDGPEYTDEIYLMVANGLTHPTGTGADCLQEITLNFAFTNGITGLVMLNPVTGQLQTNTLPVVNNLSRMVLNLNGGDAALFKFADGAPFVGWFSLVRPTTTLLSAGAVWKFLDDGSDQGTAWRGTNFNDAGWASGPAQLGYGDNDEATTVRSNRLDGTRIITTYFRRSFVVTNPPAAFSDVTLRLLRDDGAVVYLNGAEIVRSNMPPGAIDYNTRALATVGGGDESTNFHSTSISPASLVSGTNVIAVEIHQFDTNSSDISFDLELIATGNLRPVVAVTSPTNGAIVGTPSVPLTVSATDYDGNVALVEFFVGSAKLGQDATAPFTLTWTNSAEGPYTFSAVATDNNGFTATSAPVAITLQAGLISTGAVWKYLDSGINAGSAWRGTNFNDNAWASGPAQLGYGDDDEATEVGYGPNPTNKYITTYFRRRFAVTNASSFTNLLLRVLRDDGAVVYLNSNEVFRSNMPGGAIGYTTLASSSVPPADEATTFYSTNVSGTRVFNGTNVLAVEVHQASTNSSDLSFDLELIGQRPMIPPTLSIRTASPEAVLTWPEFPQGFQLESRPTLAPAATWSGVSNSITVSNGQNTLRMDVTGAASYFRLRKP